MVFIFILNVSPFLILVNTIPGNTTCKTIDAIITIRKDRYDGFSHLPNSPIKTKYWNEWQEAIQWKKDNCKGCTIPSKPFNDENLNIPLNESGYILHKYSYNGELVFCIDPNTTYNSCSSYNQGGNDLKVKIAKIVKAANNLGSPNNTEMYIGAQLYIWDILGLNRTVSGYDKGALKARIDSK